MTACSLAAAAIAGGAGSAVAIGDDGPTSLSGNGAASAFGNSTTHGNLSAEFGAVQGTLNELCLGVPAKANVGSLVGILVPITVQDVNVLASPQNQQCARNTTQSSGTDQ
ncbi:rodlin [Streptomyces ochraceiscleroticus]|uniref:Rodlin n=1 Tax=Streptomyces ochraceiscleroticus TaxID=47761 RepID=A0ABW1MTI6_9ACTN|nr:rodlin [Streptomyces ochraceiscleroticus]